MDVNVDLAIVVPTIFLRLSQSWLMFDSPTTGNSKALVLNARTFISTS